MDKPVKSFKKPANNNKKDITEIPASSPGDTAHALIKAVLSVVPSIGGPAVEFFNAIVASPLSQRRDEWIQSIAKGLRNLEGKVEGYSIENLSKNDSFITTVLHATSVAIRNHQKEKLEALRNAVINSALPNPPEEDLQLMFINFIDFLTPWHLRILSFLHHPSKFMDERGIKHPSYTSEELRTLILYVFPELKTQHEFLQQIIRDLYSRGLIRFDSIGTRLSPEEIFTSQTTDLGRQFVTFTTAV